MRKRFRLRLIPLLGGVRGGLSGIKEKDYERVVLFCLLFLFLLMSR
jgi:hypothetical protein